MMKNMNQITVEIIKNIYQIFGESRFTIIDEIAF